MAKEEQKEPQQQDQQGTEEARWEPDFVVVGIGASAGGVKALQEVFRTMPDDIGMAFVVIIHIKPDADSNLAAVLDHVTELNVVTIQDGAEIEPNTVYTPPAGQAVEIEAGRLHLVSAPSERPPAHINHFFRSLAANVGMRSLGIVLSGMGTDGSVGLKEIKANLGITFVQEPQEAEYPSMPKSAVETGDIDQILRLSEIAGALVEYRRYFDESVQQRKQGTNQSQSEYIDRILSILTSRLGHDFSDYKRSTIMRRIERRLNVHRLSSIKNYLNYLQRHSEEADELFKDLLIGVTSFFRDEEAFRTLGEQALPQVLPSHDTQKLRIWVAGCSTGEEAYSIAILVHEYISKRDLTPTVTIFATDIDERAISIARRGRYPDSVAGDISDERLERYFDHEDDHYQIKKSIRDMLVFSVQNLLTDPPFTNIDLISCRNVLIYLNQSVQNRIIPLFHYSIRDGGLLFLGNSETVRTHPELFDPLHKSERIFVRNPNASAARQIFDTALRPGRGKEGSDRDLHYHQSIRAKVEGYLLEEWTPTAVFVNADHEVEFFHGRTGRMLEPPRGAPNVNVVNMAREGLHGPLQRLLQRATTTREAVSEHDIRVRENGSFVRVDLTVVPLGERQGLRGILAIVFNNIRPDSVPAEGSPTDSRPGRTAESSAASDSSAGELRDELQMTRERLQSTIEELETSNEELKSSIEEYQSTNEELQSSNEELESSKEEMQSLNEELSTVNAELKDKNDELERSYHEMQNFLDSLDSPIIFVDEQLRVKRFTKASSAIISLNEVDIGRSITDISLNLAYDHLVADMKQVIDDSHEIVRGVKTKDGRPYTMRVRSYTDTDRVRTGVLLLFHRQQPELFE